MTPEKLAAYAAAAQAILALALIIVTIFYAWQTHRTVEEMKEGRKRASIPIITCDIEIDWGKEGVGESNKIIVQNVGNSPALETNIEVQLLNSDISILEFDLPITNFIGNIGLDKHKTILLRMKQAQILKTIIKGESAYPRIMVGVNSKNTYKVVSKTIATFELQNIEPPLAMKPADQWHWIKIDEVVKVE